MRTYTRKKPEYEIVEGVQDLCRLCLKKADESVPIFGDSQNICDSLATRIMICVGLEVSREECLPNLICLQCVKELNKCYDFRKRCTATFQKLKYHTLAIRQLEVQTQNCKIDTENNSCQQEQSSNEVDQNGEKNSNEITENHLTLEFKKNHEVLEASLDVNLLSDGIFDISKNDGSIKEIQIEICQNTLQDTPVCPDVSEFLSQILSEMGILVKHNNQATATAPCSALEIESGSGQQLTYEIIETDEETDASARNKNIVNNIDDSITSTIKYIDTVDNKDKKESRPQCATCHKRFASGGALRRHQRVHSGERPYACRECARAFAQREVLRRHELVHRAVRPFQCASCPKSFTQRAALAAHARSQHAAARALRLHRCAHCPKLFLHASGLSRHALVHAGREYECGACGRRFRDKSSLRRHLAGARHPAPAAPPAGASAGP